MPKYWGNKFSASGVSAKWVKNNRCRKKKKKRGRPKVGNNYGQLSIVKATSSGAHNPPGPSFVLISFDSVKTVHNGLLMKYCETLY